MKIKDILSEIGGVSYSGGGDMGPGAGDGITNIKTKRATTRTSTGRNTQPGTRSASTIPAGTVGRPDDRDGLTSTPTLAKPKAVAVGRPDDRDGLTSTPTVAKPKVEKSGADARHAGRTDVVSTSTVSGSARNQQAQAKFNQRQPSSVAKTTKKPTGTVGGDLSDKTLNDRK